VLEKRAKWHNSLSYIEPVICIFLSKRSKKNVTILYSDFMTYLEKNTLMFKFYSYFLLHITENACKDHLKVSKQETCSILFLVIPENPLRKCDNTLRWHEKSYDHLLLLELAQIGRSKLETSFSLLLFERSNDLCTGFFLILFLFSSWETSFYF